MTNPPGGYHTADITLPPEQTRDIIILLIDVHGVLDHLYLDGTNPELTAAANSYLHHSASDHTLASIIDAVDTLAYQLTHAMRDAVLHPDEPTRQHHPTDF